jgi:predicted lipid-binding transport protein (Tim44 family)
MQESFAYADIVVLALIAVFVVLRFRGMLGKHIDLPEQPPKQEPKRHAEKPVVAGSPGGAAGREAPATVKSESLKEPEEENDADFIAGSMAEQLPGVLKAIRRQDAGFRLRDFMEGAKTAFDMVLEAYSKADRRTLKMLLSNELLESFMANIKELKAKGHTQETTLIVIRNAELVGAVMNGAIVTMTVRFVSEQVTLIRDKAGKIVEGNPSQVDVVEDVWSFERDMRSTDPNWKLVATDVEV